MALTETYVIQFDLPSVGETRYFAGFDTNNYPENVEDMEQAKVFYSKQIAAFELKKMSGNSWLKGVGLSVAIKPVKTGGPI